MRRLVLAVVVASRIAHADGEAVALLPLDADKQLELYGEPVASEIARALTAEHVDVVVVRGKAAVPERVRLMVDGTITGRGGAVHLAVRIRDRTTGATVAKLAADAAAVTNIDSAEASLAQDVLHAVQAQLAKRAAPPPEPGKADATPKPPPPSEAPHAIRIALGKGALQELGPAASEWTLQHHRTVATAAEPQLEATVALDPISYEVTPGEVAMATARVRVRITDRNKTLKFDRIVVTDTVVGDKNLPADQLAARVAREVLAIVEPHMRRAIEAWH